MKMKYLLLLLFASMVLTQNSCPEDLRLCPDGSSVGRDVNNNCEFFPCPGEEVNETETTLETTLETTEETLIETNETIEETLIETSETIEETLIETNETIEETLIETNETIEETLIETNETTFEETTEETLIETNETIEETLIETNETIEETLIETNETIEETLIETNETTFETQPTVSGVEECPSDNYTCPDGRMVSRNPDDNCEFYPCPERDTKCEWCVPEPSVNETQPETVTVPEECPFEYCGVCYPNGLPLGNAFNSSCGRGTSRFGGFCACWSGAYGKNCSMDDAVSETVVPLPWKEVKNINYLNLDLESMAEIHFEMGWSGHPSCQSFIDLEHLKTNSPPIIESATIENSNLKLKVSHAMVNGRAETIAYLNGGHNSSHCIYPMSDYIFKEIEGCKDVFNFEIPWNLTSACNWRLLDEETHLSYCGQVILQHTEWMSNICEWRFTQSVLNIKIRFQKFVRVQVESVVVNRPNITSAITNQIVLVNCPEPVLIEITSLINWPYKLDTNFNLTLWPSGKVDSYELDFDDCTAKEGEFCKQRWRTSLDLSASACSLDGEYQLTFPRVLCVDESNCALKEEDMNSSVKIDYSLTSENFCAVVKVDISLAATVEIYEDQEFSLARSLFVLGQKAYFKVRVKSQLNSSENIIMFNSISIRSVTLRGELSAYPVYVVENGERTTVSGLTGEESVSYEEIKLDSNEEIAFSFDMTHSLISKLLKKNGKNTFIVGVEIEVSYSNGEQKRDIFEIFAEGTDSATFSVEAGISNNDDDDDESSASALLFSLLLFFFALFF